MRPTVRNIFQDENMQIPVELKRKYLERRIQDIEQLMLSLDQNDFAPAFRLGHQVKGNAATFDVPQIASLGLQIENAAKKQDSDRIKNLIKIMSTEIQQARLNFH